MCALALALPSVAWAQPRTARVAVGAFTGERAAVTRSMVASLLANHVGEIELVSQSEYNTAASGAGPQLDEATVTAIARSLRLDEIVTGSLERINGGWRLRLRVLRGRDGRNAGTASWEFQRIEELNALNNEIWEQLRNALQPDASTPRSAPSSTPSESPTAPSPSDTPREPEAPSTATDTEAPTPGLGWLWIHLGGGLSGRVWRIPLLGETTPRGYENTAFGEIRGTIAAYYRLNQNRFGIGVEGTVGVPLGLSSQGRGPDGRIVPIATSAIEAQFGASLAVRPWNGGMMRFFAGMVYHQFSLDTSRLSPEMRLAPISYVGLRIAGEGTLPIVARREFEVGVIFGGELRLAAVGSEVKEAFGLNPDTTFGFGCWFGLGVRLDRATPGLGMRVTAEFTRYATDFAGPARVGPASESVDDYTRYLFTMVYAVGTDRGPRRPTSETYVERGAIEPDQPPPQRNTSDPFGSR